MTVDLVHEPTTLTPTIVTIGITDPEVLLALSEYAEGSEQTQFLTTALKVGVMALKAAKGTIDSNAVRHEGDRLMTELSSRLGAWRAGLEERITGSLSRYFDPKDGLFMERVDRLTRSDGELSAVMRQQVTDAQGHLTRVFDSFIGENSRLVRLLDPTGDNQLVDVLKQTLDAVVATQNVAMNRQFSLDNKDGALVRFLGELTAKHGDIHGALTRDMKAVVAEFSLDEEDSALSRLVARVEASQERVAAELSLDQEDSALQRLSRMLTEHNRSMVRNQSDLTAKLDTLLASVAVRRGEAARSTRHGVEFEEALGNHLRLEAEAAGDVLQESGATTGLVTHCKVGDHILTIGPEKLAAGARIVIEAKENASYDLAKTLEEADLARRNRQATVCVFVHSTRTAPNSIPTFARYGHDIVVKWDADDDAHDVYLKAALMVAAALSVRATTHGKEDAASFTKIDRAVERVRKAIEGFEEINISATTAKRAAEKILERARLTQETLAEQIECIFAEFTKLKESAAAD
jgi:hypothetical protein